MKGRKESLEGSKRLGTSFATGAIALVFLIIGYQTAVFIHHAAVMKILSDRDRPDTVFVVSTPVSEEGERSPGRPVPSPTVYRKSSPHDGRVLEERARNTGRRWETFRFDPNTVSVEDLQRLGFSQRQAQSIDNYRKKGGRFRRKGDFAKSYVVADSVYRRLEPFIDIPLIDLNKADSADLETLPGIGGWFASRMVAYRKRLGGYSYKEQLMDIPRFDREKYEGLEDLVTVDKRDAVPYPLWTLPEDSLKKHPYIGSYGAHGIVLFRENNPKSKWKVEELEKAGVLTGEDAGRLSRCSIAEP
ncbi:MAG: helix-hairpin-helix domain-containing protein [Bacteroidales bacterium]|nr:helix-hairpin-helix domain-containing protein [Bacteroidales bacterium]